MCGSLGSSDFSIIFFVFMKSVKEILGIRTQGNIRFNNPEHQNIEQGEDFATKKVIRTREFIIDATPGTPESAPGYLKNDAFGVVTGGNSLPAYYCNMIYANDSIDTDIDDLELGSEGCFVKWIAWNNRVDAGDILIEVSYTDITGTFHDHELICTIDSGVIASFTGEYYSRGTTHLYITFSSGSQNCGFAMHGLLYGIN